MKKKLLVILISLGTSILLLNSGYGEWNDRLEANCQIKIAKYKIEKTTESAVSISRTQHKEDLLSTSQSGIDVVTVPVDNSSINSLQDTNTGSKDSVNVSTQETSSTISTNDGNSGEITNSTTESKNEDTKDLNLQ